MALSSEQIVEIQKYQRLLNMLEKTLASSRNDDQKKRVSKDIQKYKNKILSISPDGIPVGIMNSTSGIAAQNINYSPAVGQSSQPGKKQSQQPQQQQQEKANDVLANIAVMKLSPHSTDNEINYIATLVNILEYEYIPVLGDSHIKFDYSHAIERDNVMKHLENMRRTLKVLTETIEEYALSDKQDFKEQLGRMKNKQSRIFISEAGELFKVFKQFLEKIHNDLKESSGVILNPAERMHFNPRFERATILEGKDAYGALRQFLEFTSAALEVINIPNLKK